MDPELTGDFEYVKATDIDGNSLEIVVPWEIDNASSFETGFLSSLSSPPSKFIKLASRRSLEAFFATTFSSISISNPPSGAQQPNNAFAIVRSPMYKKVGYCLFSLRLLISVDMKIAIKLDISTGGSSDKENSGLEAIRSAEAPAGGCVIPN